MAFRLYDYQEEMRVRLCEGFLTHGALMCQMPTGTGKTHVLAAVVASVAGPGDEVWVVAHRRELVDQVRRTWDTLCRGLRGAPAVRVLSIQWLSRHWDDVASCKPRMIVIDEAHHALAPSYRELFVRYPEAKKLGMTATPCRLGGEGFSGLFDSLLQSRSIPEFITMGRLSLFDYYSVPSDSKIRRQIALMKKHGPDGDYQVREMERTLNTPRYIEHLYNSLSQYAPNRRGIVYAINICHARAIADFYSAKGLNCCAIDCKTSQRERDAKVEAFRRGEIDVIVNVDIFSEGFDCPEVEFIQLARPTLSLAVYLQQIGRGLRRAKGKRDCVILDCVGLCKTFGLPIREWDWQSTFRGTKTGLRIDSGDRRNLLKFLGYPGKLESEPLEKLIDHGRMADAIDTESTLVEFCDSRTGLIGFKVRNKVVHRPCFTRIVQQSGAYAIVIMDGIRVLIDSSGNVNLLARDVIDFSLMAGDVLRTTTKWGIKYYDLKKGIYSRVVKTDHRLLKG